MTAYSAKILNNLEPGWVTKRDKAEMRKNHAEELKNKPVSISCGSKVKAISSNKSITKDRVYSVRGHFCYLVSTIYDSHWNQFVTIKNDNGWTVKMNLENFILIKTENEKTEI
jgi:hypothetical protein